MTIQQKADMAYDLAIQAFLRDYDSHGVWAVLDTMPAAASAARRDLAENARALGVQA